jgi:F-type H+-transporting ATPase subunit delta
MANVDDQQLALGAIYARALFEVAEQRGATDQVLEELEGIADYLDRDPDLADFLGSPLVEADAKASLLEKGFRGRASDLVVDTLQVVNRKGRLDALPAIAEAFVQQYRSARGIVDVTVKTAVPLTPELRARLIEAASRYTGKRAHLIETVDPSLIGGMVVQVGDDKIDASVASRLKALSAALLRRGAAEIHRGTAYTEG